ADRVRRIAPGRDVRAAAGASLIHCHRSDSAPRRAPTPRRMAPVVSVGAFVLRRSGRQWADGGCLVHVAETSTRDSG
ncbi:hypothetical protein, partial [Frankia sp. AgKG'84/4]|uniref:hypothetical protein n=1 Tax=Frankia sp. AgKG'84/4 TaxID=573490 RepID=UPI00202A0C63